MKSETSKALILGGVLVVLIGLIFYLEQGKVSPKLAGSGELEIKEGRFPKAPELSGIVGYINTDPGLNISSLKGKVVLVDFWTYTCINCIRTLPHLTEWDRKYRDKGLVIIGVHTPEFEFEKEYNNVQDAANKYNIKYPIVQDNFYATWSAYKNRFWPHKYLIDKEGFIRYDHIGEGAYKRTEEKILELLAELDVDISDMRLSDLKDETPTTFNTPELYAGYDFAVPRGQDIGNKEGLQLGQTISYTLPSRISGNAIYLEGTWKSNKDDLQAISSSAIVLDFQASSVNIVASYQTEPVRMEVLLDDSYISAENAGDDVEFEDGIAFVNIDEARLYDVVNKNHDRHVLRLNVREGFTFNAFTFG